MPKVDPIGELWGTARQVARALDTSIRNVQNWANAGNIGAGERGYEYVSASQLQIRKLRDQVARLKAKGSGAGGLEDAQTRKTNAEADIKELQRDVMRGELVSKSEAVATYQDLVTRCKSKLLSMPSRVAGQLVDVNDPLEIEELLRDVVDEALLELKG